MGYDTAMMNSLVILENIRSAHNVGSIFRTADAAGVQQLYVTGYTPAPVDRFGRPVPEISKTALGATETVAWQQVVDAVALVQELQASGVYVVAVEQAPAAINIYHYETPAHRTVAYVFGNEVTGITGELLAQVDQVVEVPMVGQKESLNVAVTAGIVLYLTNQVHA